MLVFPSFFEGVNVAKRKDLLMATKELKKAQIVIRKIQDPIQAMEAKIMLASLQNLFYKRWEFKNAFKASELWVEADRKLFKMLSQPGLSLAELSKSLGATFSALQNLKYDLKRAYDKSEEELQSLKKKAFDLGVLLTRQFFIQHGKGAFSTGEQEWYTPPWVYERARHIMGSIDLDPASSKEAQNMGNKAKRYFTKEDSALKKEWGICGNVFINPPHTLDNGKSGAIAFLKKLMSSHYRQAILVLLEDSGTSYGPLLWPICSAVFIPKGKLHFIFEGEEEVGKSTTWSTLVFGIGVDTLKFWLAFKDFGEVVSKYKHANQLYVEVEERSKELKLWLKKLEALPKRPLEALPKRPVDQIQKPKSLAQL